MFAEIKIEFNKKNLKQASASINGKNIVQLTRKRTLELGIELGSL